MSADVFFGLLVFAAGLAAGSFANVVIYRVPAGESVVRPKSHCPHCGHDLAWHENIPVISYLWLRGRCSNCRKRISVRYPLVEALVGIAWLAMWLRVGFAAELPAFLVMVTVLIILATIDLEHRRIPNEILGPASIVAVLALAAAAMASGDPASLKDPAIGIFAYGLPLLGLAIAVPAGMGMGDVKLAGYLGWHLGWFSLLHVAVGAFTGFLLGAAAGLLLMAVGKKSRKSTIPFGPAMASGTLVAVLWGKALVAVWSGEFLF